MNNVPPTTHRISEFHKWNKEGVLELKPPYQRKPVWSENNRSYLIDSILNGYPVPEVYIQVSTDVTGNTKYFVVDGQQRIRSILDFIEGEYEILESESTSYGGKNFPSLPDGIKKDFWDFPIVTRELKTTSDDEVRAVFKRLNKYVIPLNKQELRNATYSGHFIQLISELGDDEYWIDNKIVSPSDVRRMNDLEYISELVIAMLHGIQGKTTESIDGFYKMYDETFPDKESIKKKFHQIIVKSDEVLGDLRQTRWHHKTEFYSLFLALNRLIDEYQIPTERHEEIRSALCDFSAELDKYIIPKKGESQASDIASEFARTVLEHSTSKDERTRRTNMTRDLIIPFLIAKDPKRDFTEEERRIAWANSKDKKCAICKKTVDWEEYSLDHIIPHSKGGKTELRNSQIMHKKCNSSKNDR